MGIFERREREKAERKALIMRCAKELILEFGAEKVSMMDIAKKAELSKATLYLYFPSKALLFMEICKAAGIQFIEFFRSRKRPGLTAMETIRLYWTCYLEMYGESDEMMVIFSMWQYLAPDHPFLSLEEEAKSFTISEFYTAIRDMLAQGIAEETFDADVDPAMMARTMLSLFSVVIENTAKLPRDTRDAPFIMDELTKIFQILLRGMAREGLDRSLLTLPNPAEKQQPRE
jgi:AcrR family transcriptional regulator